MSPSESASASSLPARAKAGAGRRWAGFLVKLAISAVAIALVLANVDFRAAFAEMSHQNVGLVVLASLLTLLQVAAVGTSFNSLSRDAFPIPPRSRGFGSAGSLPASC